MKKQYIEISLDEYKQLRDILEDYKSLLGEYKLLSYAYNLLQPQEEKIKEKNPIGFHYEEGKKQQ